jgi:hypothetical protein
MSGLAKPVQDATLGLLFFPLDCRAIGHFFLDHLADDTPPDFLAEFFPSVRRSRVGQEGGEERCPACGERSPRWPDMQG